MLTAEQISFFKDNGYLLLRGVMDPELCAQTRDRLWSFMPENSAIKRDDPSTHIGPFTAQDTREDSEHLRKDYRWQVREVGTEPLLIDLVYSDTLNTAAEQLLGKGMVQAPVVGGSTMGRHGPAWPGGPVDPAVDVEGMRGIYCTLPYGDVPRQPNAAHTDGHPFHLGMVGLIDDVPPDGGAFKIWPKSHKRLYPTFWMQYDQMRVPFYKHLPSYKGIVHTPEYEAELKRIHEDTQAVDCWGSVGDVVLWHHRLAHMAGHNYSAVIRQAVLGDFSKIDLDTTRMDPPQADMWRDWSDTIKHADSCYSEAFAREQRLIC